MASFTAVKGAVTDLGTDDFPLSFATALFSFLYHLATYEASKCVEVGWVKRYLDSFPDMSCVSVLVCIRSGNRTR